MPTYYRNGVQDGGDVVLKAVFTDALDNFIDSTDMPQVYIYSEDIDSAIIDAEIEAGVFASAIAGPLTPTRITTGFYELTYTVPDSASPGVWRDVWIGSLGSDTVSQVLQFTVLDTVNIKDQRLATNQLVIIELDKTIGSYAGLTLAADIQLSFTTLLKPFYASTDMVRMEIGPWIDFIPDSTLALMIHFSSLEADFIQGWRGCDIKRLRFARSKFIVFDAVLRAFYLPGSSAYQPGGATGGSKSLGDLSIKAGSGALVAQTSSGIDVNTLGYIKAQRDEWFRVVNAGGNIMPGESLPMSIAVRAKYDPDRRKSGRQWLDPDEHYYDQPGTNSKVKGPGNRYRGAWRPTPATSGTGLGNPEYD